jgi:hypothetical protein
LRYGCSDLRQAEIQNLGMSSFSYEDVRWLYIAVDNAFGVGCVERIGNFNGEREYGFIIERFSRDQMLQSHTVQKLHGNERLLIVFANFVDGANVGMIQRGSGFGFPPEPFQCLPVLGNVFREEFERYESIETGVLGLVDHAHPATAELFDDAVMRNGLPDHWAEILGPEAAQVNDGR